jgi:exonuclease III
VRLRVATWNMNHWAWRAEDRRRAWEFLDEVVAPDVALVQEAAVPPGRARVVGPEGPASAKRPWGAMVVSREQPIARLPIVRVRWHRGTVDLLRTLLGSVAVARVTPAEAAPVVAISVYGGVEPGFESTTMHRILSDLTPLLDGKHGKRVVLGGDFSCSTQVEKARRARHGNVFDRVRALGLVDLLAGTRRRRPRLRGCPCGASDCAHVQTHRAKRSRVPWQFDYLYATRPLAERVTLCRALNGGEADPWALSDHCPVVADFDL